MGLRPFNVLSLCTGIGGLDIGLRLANPDARVVCYVEREAHRIALLAEKMEKEQMDEAPIWSDLRTFDGRPWRGIADCVTGGYPCQPFSTAGKRLGSKDPRYLWPYIKRIVEEVKPEWCFFENVAGHLRLGFEQVWYDLRSVGYRVAAGLFSAEEVGSPQARERLFILAHANGSCCNSRPTRPLKFLQQLTDASCPLGFYPPAPDQSWAEVCPDLKPTVCRMATRIPDWVDRISALGNSVMPEVAALAWRILHKALVNEGKD